MAVSNSERVGNALAVLNEGLRPFVDQELRSVFGDDWEEKAAARANLHHDDGEWDTYAILKIMWSNWNEVFSRTLGRSERSLVSELQDVRNSWAHQTSFSTDDAHRALDSMSRLLKAIASPVADKLENEKQEILRIKFHEKARWEKRKAVSTLKGSPAESLKPWREVVTPHPDVTSGEYSKAEFAADLSQVHRGEALPEYQDPVEFFSRTFITEGMRNLLRGALRRLQGIGGDPLVQLQTNFGGGKTHSMLALYHLFSGIQASKLPGMEPVLKDATCEPPEQVRKAVLVGTAISPADARTKPDGTVVNTFWGEMAWQLLGAKGYAFVANSDRAGVSPGSDILKELLQKASPCMVLIDEWIAHVRMLYGKQDLPGGSFDSNFTFAQSLTEAVRATDNCLLVASIPASDIEKGGEAGKLALERLVNVFGRMDSPWRPASSDEGFEIVRRRLFEPITDDKLFTARDTVINAFSEYYGQHSGEFPSYCKEAEYKRRMTMAYPIHPELFDKLYNDWSTLDKFQRTRGVLRLMATVIHHLWVSQDKHLMILPSSIAMDDKDIQGELTRYLDDTWAPVIETDVDGVNSLPMKIDGQSPNLGRYSAARRVARAVYVGSAPTLQTANRGVEDREIKLGCAQPGEAPSTFGDALRQLAGKATYLYNDGQRYWYDTHPTVAKLARDRASQIKPDRVHDEIEKLVREQLRDRADFKSIHAFPADSGDVPDEMNARLVVLSPEVTHLSSNGESPALIEAKKILENRGNSPRVYRNTLVFLAADEQRMLELEDAVREWLAWQSICDDREILNLDPFQFRQSETEFAEAKATVEQRIPETFRWVLVPRQEVGEKESSIEVIRVQPSNGLAHSICMRLKRDGLLNTVYSGITLKLELDRIPLWRGDHVSLEQLAEDFARYQYLPRLVKPELIIGAVEQGVSLTTWMSDSFAYAEGYDEAKQRYIGLQAGRIINARLSKESLVVKPDVAARQLEEESVAEPREVVSIAGKPLPDGTPEKPGTRTDKVGSKPLPKRFFGTVKLDPHKMATQAGQINSEIISHMTGLVGSEAEVILDITITMPEGAPEVVQRTVEENCRTLRFEQQGFEEE